MRLILAVLCIALASCGNSSGSTSQPPAAATSAPSPPPAPLTTTAQVVFTGDSITMLMPTSEYVPGSFNAGISGNETCQMLARFDADVLARHPAIVVLLGGVNDIKNHDTFDTSCLFSMVQKAMAAGARVIVGTVMPATRLPRVISENLLIVELNSQLRMGAQQYGYTLVDYYRVIALPDGGPNQQLLDDGLHPNRAGFDAMWGALRPLLAQ